MALGRNPHKRHRRTSAPPPEPIEENEGAQNGAGDEREPMPKVEPAPIDASEPDHVELAKETLAGDLRDTLLDIVKEMHSPLPLGMRPEAEQRKVIERCQGLARRIVTKVSVIVATEARKPILAQLAQVQLKDEIKLTILVNKADEQRHFLMDAVGSPVLLSLANAAQFMGQRGDPHVTVDQPELDLEPKDDDE